jgi:hypothetical protein
MGALTTLAKQDHDYEEMLEKEMGNFVDSHPPTLGVSIAVGTLLTWFGVGYLRTSQEPAAGVNIFLRLPRCQKASACMRGLPCPPMYIRCRSD